MKMKEREYWQKRLKQIIRQEDKVLRDLAKKYNIAEKELMAFIAELYVEMGEEISPKTFYTGDKYKRLSQEIEKLTVALGEDEDEEITDFLTSLGEEEQKKHNEHFLLGVLLFVPVYGIIKSKWNDKLYTDRIMDNKKELAKQLEKVIITAIAKGDDLKKLKAEVKSRFSALFSRTESTVRTESMYVYNQVHLANYKSAGYTHYEYLAIIDSRTTEWCRELNGQRFKLDEAEVGVNYPPRHVRCRSTVVPVKQEKV